MKRPYISPSFITVQVDLSQCLCLSYGTLPVGGRTDSFDDSSGFGTISTGGGRADELDAARSRDWRDYEGVGCW